MPSCGRSRPRVPGPVLLLAASLVAVSCSSSDARGEVLTPFGNTLDCIDERIAYTTFDQAHLGAVGWDEPAEALAAYPELDRPPGTPNLEESTYSEAVFVFTSPEGHRLGRVGVGLTQQGWYVMWAEKCALVTANEGPSQTPADARRDGVVPALAELPFALRVRPLVEVPAEEGIWILATPTEAVGQAAAAEGCLLGDTGSVDPEEVICVTEYGEVLLVDGAGAIVRAYPMPAAKPTWIAVRPDAVYAGRVGDGALPDSTLVRIDRHTLEAEVLAIQSSMEPDLENNWPDAWHVATPGQARLYADLVRSDQEATGQTAESWTGPVVIDPEGIDRLFAEMAP